MALLVVAAYLAAAASQGGIAADTAARRGSARPTPPISPRQVSRPSLLARRRVPSSMPLPRSSGTSNRTEGLARGPTGSSSTTPPATRTCQPGTTSPTSLGGDRLQVYDHNPLTTQGPASRIATSQNVAWHVATSLLGQTQRRRPTRRAPRLGPAPHRQRQRAAPAGFSTRSPTSTCSPPAPSPATCAWPPPAPSLGDGVITPVRHVDAKLAAARLAHPDVFFAPTIPPGNGDITTVVSHQGQPTSDRTIGDWLNTAGYEHAGRIAATHPGTLALVTIDDIRQALSWLCGRTQRPATCTLADTAAATPLAHRPPLQPPTNNPVKANTDQRRPTDPHGTRTRCRTERRERDDRRPDFAAHLLARRCAHDPAFPDADERVSAAEFSDSPACRLGVRPR